MDRLRNVLAWGLAAGILLAGCDPAETLHKKCLALKADEPEAALVDCKQAVKKAPDSEHGKAAAALIPDLEKRIEKLEQERAKARREAKRRAKQVKLEAEAARQRAVTAARGKIRREYWSRDTDGQCVADGLPPYRWNYEGGSREEIDLVAADDGCRHLFPGRNDFILFQIFCCP